MDVETASLMNTKLQLRKQGMSFLTFYVICSTVVASIYFGGIFEQVSKFRMEG